MQNLQKLEAEKNARREQLLETERNRLALLEREEQACAEKLGIYRQYPYPEEVSSLTEAQASEAESRYEIITGGISAEQKELEERARLSETGYAGQVRMEADGTALVISGASARRFQP